MSVSRHGLLHDDSSTGALAGRTVPSVENHYQRSPGTSVSFYGAILLKHRWLLITCALSVTTVVALVSFRAKPVYRASARVQVEAETPLIASLDELAQKPDADDVFVQTQIQVLKSDNLAWRTVQQLNLDRTLISAEELEKPPHEARKTHLIEKFREGLTVELVPRTRMLIVSFESTRAELAAQVASTLVENFVEYNFRQKYDATRRTSSWMEQQLDELKAKVEASQRALVEYERRYQIVSTSDRQNLLEQRLADLSRDLTSAESERMQRESLYLQVLADRSRIAALAHNELLQKLEEKAADLQGQYSEALAQYGPQFPKVVRLQAQAKDNQAQIAREQTRVIDRIRQEYEAARNREALAVSAVDDQKQHVGELNQRLVEHNLLQREFESNQHLYENLLQRLKDATVSAGLRRANIHVVDPALLPLKPIRPRIMFNLIAGFLAGLVLGMIVAFLQESRDCSVRTAEEVEILLGVPALAEIPLHRSQRQDRCDLAAGMFGWTGRETRAATVGLTVSRFPRSPLAEAYRSLRTAILFSVAPEAPKRLLIASTLPGEGKTATALNLAQSLAQQKRSVILCDCDLRKGNVARLLGIEGARGLSTLLSGADLLEDAIVPFAGQPNLWVLPAGPVPSNPAELLACEAMVSVWAQLQGRYEHVIMDSPPVLAVTDATLLSRLVDGVILVAESGRTSRSALLRTRSILEASGAHVFGVVLNKLDLRYADDQGCSRYYSYDS